MIFPQQIKFAMNALGWTNSVLSKKASIHKNTVIRAKSKKVYDSTLVLMRLIFEREGVIFLDQNIIYKGEIIFVHENECKCKVCKPKMPNKNKLN